MQIAALILAAGRGTRVGCGIPKQWRPLAGRDVLEHSLTTFANHPKIDRIVVVLHKDDWARAPSFEARGFTVARGGAERAASVQAGLAALSETPPRSVLIHDGARPCVTPALIDRVLQGLNGALAAAPALQVTDALWTGAERRVTGTQDRTGLFAAQTPQGFDYAAIQAAHAASPPGAADDVEVARAAGLDIAIVPGDADNLKITTAADFARAERILGRDMNIRLGNGFDVHRFGPGDHVTLCGVRVPYDRGLQGHSDADVGLHAITDSIFGALADGDIGQHFPPSDPKWRGADSAQFLAFAAERAAARGFVISNVDCTLICEFPKIGPHAGAMRARVADILGLSADQVSVKATTSERLGFTGRQEGIAALATACLMTA